MDKIKDRLYRSNEFQRLGREAGALAPGESLVLRSAAGSLLAFVATHMYEERQGQGLLVASDEEQAEKLRDDCALIIGEGNVRFFGARPVHQAQVLDLTSGISQIETLKALTTGVKYFIVASPHSVVEKVPPPQQFSRTIIEINVGQDCPFQHLIGKLDQIGFERKDFVESYGDFAVRGGIIDVFPYVGENPIRLEFWGDTVESIREFDVLSQRSIRELQVATVVPSLPSPAAPAGEGSGTVQDQQSASLLDYLQKDALVILDEPEIIGSEIAELLKEGATNILTPGEFSDRVAKYPMLINSLLGAGDFATGDRPDEILPGQPARAPKASVGERPKSEISFGSVSQPSFNGSINQLVETLGQLTADGYSIFLTSDTKEEAGRLGELIEEAGADPERAGISRAGEIVAIDEAEKPDPERLQPADEADIRHPGIHPVFLTETVHSGFIDRPARIAVLTEHEIFSRIKRRGVAKRRRFKGFSQKEMQQLRRGDYVVHVDHGIGTFAGLTKISVGGVEQEAMKLLFFENDVLYVNLNFINRVQKYASQEGHIPKLNRLGAPDWERAEG